MWNELGEEAFVSEWGGAGRKLCTAVDVQKGERQRYSAQDRSHVHGDLWKGRQNQSIPCDHHGEKGPRMKRAWD